MIPNQANDPTLKYRVLASAAAIHRVADDYARGKIDSVLVAFSRPDDSLEDADWLFCQDGYRDDPAARNVAMGYLYRFLGFRLKEAERDFDEWMAK